MKRVVTTLFLVCTVVLTFSPAAIAHAQVQTQPTGATLNTQQQISVAAQKLNTPNNTETAAAADACGSWSAEGIACSIVRAAVKAFFALLITITGTLMRAGGALFDASVSLFVVNMGEWMVTWGILKAIESIWSVFRDIGNIVLIGMFIFIAIRTILGVGGSSNKQLVINIIIVSLIINFSLFFVKATLDVTNFFAFQFYKSISQLKSVDANGNVSTRIAGVSERFSTLSGVARITPGGSSSPWDRLTQSVDKSSSMNQGRSSSWGSITAAAVNGIGIAGMYLGAAIVFFYGAVLVLIRGIMLILIMISSSLAFTTFVLPLPSVRKYFDEWKDALLQNAIFGPLLMLLMWASITLADALVGVNGSNAAQNDPGGLTALFNYALVIGFMFASIKIAATLAAKTDSSMFGLKPRTGMTNLWGNAVGGAFDRYAKRRIDSTRQGAYDKLIGAEGERDAARRAFKDNQTPENSAKYAAARKKVDDVRKKLDTKPLDMRDGTLAKLMKGIGANVGKPDNKAQTLLKGADQEKKKKEEDAVEVGKLAREIRKDQEALQKEVNIQKNTANDQVISALDKQQKATQRMTEATEDLQKLQTAQAAGEDMVTLRDGTRVRKGTMMQEQINSTKKLIEEAKQQSALHAADAERFEKVYKNTSPESVRVQQTKVQQEKADTIRRENVSLIKQVAETLGKKGFDDRQVSRAAEIIPKSDPELKRDEGARKQAEREAERLERRAQETKDREAREEKRAASQPTPAAPAAPKAGGDNH